MTLTDTPLRKAAKFIRGITFKPEDVCSPAEPGAVVCMRTKNIQADIDLSDLIAIPEAFVRRAEQNLIEGDLLISSANSWNLVGKACWVPKLSYRSTAGGFISILRCDRDLVFPRYFYHWVTSVQTQHDLRNCGRQTTNISNLDFDGALELAIPLPYRNGKPDLDEQKRIASILDKADAIRRKLQQSLRLSDDFLRSVFLDMFGDPVTNPKGWKIGRMGDYSDQLTGYAFKSSEYVQAGEGVRLCRGANVLPGVIDWSDRADWPKDQCSLLDRFQLIQGDIVVAMDRPWISSGFKTARITEHDVPSLLVQRVARIRAKAPLSNNYLFSLLNQGSFARHCKPTETTIPHISPIELREFPVAIPSKTQLEKFDKIYLKLSHAKCAMQRKAHDSEHLFFSLQQRAFRGEL
jgi:type I restriction enzyme S subunit